MTKSLQGQPSIFDQSFVSNKSLKYVSDIHNANSII